MQLQNEFHLNIYIYWTLIDNRHNCKKGVVYHLSCLALTQFLAGPLGVGDNALQAICIASCVTPFQCVSPGSHDLLYILQFSKPYI